MNEQDMAYREMVKKQDAAERVKEEKKMIEEI